MTSRKKCKFKVGEKVRDLDGYKGVVTKITHHHASAMDWTYWYDVRFQSGEAVRYEGDLISERVLDLADAHLNGYF